MFSHKRDYKENKETTRSTNSLNHPLDIFILNLEKDGRLTWTHTFLLLLFSCKSATESPLTWTDDAGFDTC